MGKAAQERVRVRLDSWTFSRRTKLAADQVKALADQAAESTATKMNGKIRPVREEKLDTGFRACVYEMVGLGAVVQWMDFAIIIEPTDVDGILDVRLSIKDYRTEEHGFGIHYTISGAGVMDRFVEIVTRGLGSAPPPR